MKRPEVELANYKEVYDFYKTHRQGRRVARFLHGVLGVAFAPKVDYEEGAQEQIDKLFRESRSVVLASNHIKATDPCVIAAMVQRDETLRPLLGNTFIPSKKSIQDKPIVQHIVDGLGGVPVFREKDMKPGDNKRMLIGAARGLVNTAVERMESGQHMALFPEGERKTDPLRVQELQNGIGLMVCRVAQIGQPTIVPMALYYGEENNQLRHPNVFIGQPSDEPFPKGRDLMQWLPDRLQDCLDQAILHR